MDRHRIPKEKLVIGPAMVLLEMSLFGNYFETIKIHKQTTNKSYPQIINNLWNNYRFKSFHLGFYPWGMSQCIKGVPVLFVQSESEYLLKKYNIGNNKKRLAISGLLGGMSQGLMLTPTQRLKTIAITQTRYPGMNTYHLLRNYVNTYGYKTLFNGLTPMMVRRGSDWSVRFYGIGLMSNYLGKEINQMSLQERLLTGCFGGLLSGFTVPLDVLISKTQQANINSSSYQVLLEQIKNHGYHSFMRGYTMKVLHACHHTAIMIGIGGYISNKFQ
jgi:hypothetical protein